MKNQEKINKVISTNLMPPRADLHKNEFDRLIAQKGKDVTIEKVVECPCIGKVGGSALSNCRNCGGIGFVWLEPVNTRMVLTGISVVNEYRPWTEEMRGMVNITAFHEQEMSFMDRITDIDGESIYTEILHVKRRRTEVYANSIYPIKEVLYIAEFVNENEPLRKLIEGVDFEIDENRPYYIHFRRDVANGITIRYKHSPQFLIIEMKRETMQSHKYEAGNEIEQSFPVSALARRAHYQIKAKNLNDSNLIENTSHD